MAARLIPKTDDGSFPYEEARRQLLEHPAMQFGPFDFGPMIEAGRRIGWTQEMVEANEALARGGKCFAFRMTQEPFLQGTLFEDNVFFSFTGKQHQLACMEEIERLARELDVRVLR